MKIALKTLLFILALSVNLFSEEWPKIIKHPYGTEVTFYQPQIESFDKVTIESRAAIIINTPRPSAMRPSPRLAERIALLAVAACVAAAALAGPPTDPARALELGENETAIAAYRERLVRHPDDLDALLGSARAQLRLGDAAGAGVMLDRLLARAPDHAAAREERGLIALGAGRDAEAQADLERAVAADPRRWRAWNGLGLVALRQGRPAEALVGFDLAAAIRSGRSAGSSTPTPPAP